MFHRLQERSAVLISHGRMPPHYMMDMGKRTSHFFDSNGGTFSHKTYHLKSLAQSSRERNVSELPGKRYFGATTLSDIINQAPMPNFEPSRHEAEMEKGECTQQKPRRGADARLQN